MKNITFIILNNKLKISLKKHKHLIKPSLLVISKEKNVIIIVKKDDSNIKINCKYEIYEDKLNVSINFTSIYIKFNPI